MTVVATYHVVESLFHNPAVQHQISLVTTEYTCGNNVLVHLLFGGNLGIRMNNLVSSSLKRDVAIPNEQFFFGKTYKPDKMRALSRSAFEEKRNGFDAGRTLVVREILVEYEYTDLLSASDSVQIVVRMVDGRLTANIDFQDVQQYENFCCPEWLSAMRESV